MNNKEELNNEKKPSGKGRAAKQRFYAILTCVFAVIFICAVIWLIVYFVQNSRAQDNMQEIKDNYIEEAQTQESAAPTEHSEEATTEQQTSMAESIASSEVVVEDPLAAYEVPEKTIDFDALREQENEHIYAWITIPGTVIDYPVLQHPEEIGYYLNRNLDHSTGYPGCIYSQLYNSKEWDDPMTVLYGHNMKNGTMFAGLHQYADPEFFAENKYVYIYSEDKVRVYEIFAAYEYTNVDLVLMRLYGGEKQYGEYLDSIYTLDGLKNNFDTEIEVTTESKILTLETCIANQAERRYLVQAVLVAEGDA